MLEQLQQFGLSAEHFVDDVFLALIVDDAKDRLKPFYDNVKEKAAELLEKIRLPENHNKDGQAKEGSAKQEWAKQERELMKELNTQKPEFADVVKAEDARNEIERATLRTQQEKALGDALKLADKRGLGPTDREELQKFMEGKFKEKQEQLSREQQERGDRLELLYRGPPSTRER